MADNVKGGWTEGEKAKVLWSLIDITAIDWSKCFIPPNRTRNAVGKMLKREHAKVMGEISAYDNANGTSTPATPKTPKTPRAKAVATPKKTGAKTPSKTPRKGKIVGSEDEDEDENETPVRKRKRAVKDEIKEEDEGNEQDGVQVKRVKTEQEDEEDGSLEEEDWAATPKF